MPSLEFKPQTMLEKWVVLAFIGICSILVNTYILHYLL
jgi:hypothetical protein